PPQIEPGKETKVTLVGRNLPGGKPAGAIDGRPVEAVEGTVSAPAAPTPVRNRVEPVSGTQDGFEDRLPRADPGPIHLAKDRVGFEATADHTTPETAQSIPVPCEVAGRIDRPNDRDWYSFTAKKGEVFYVDLFAERVGGRMDGVLSIVNAANKQEIAG